MTIVEKILQHSFKVFNRKSQKNYLRKYYLKIENLFAVKLNISLFILQSSKLRFFPQW